MLHRAVTALLFATPALAAAQHAPGPAPRASLALGVSAVAVVTRVSPAFVGRDFTEGYLTQPVLMARAGLLGDAVTLRATLDAEGLTMERGELTAGSYGEGYVDRRHPHTYLHELLASLATPPLTLGGTAVRASVAGGKGFAPFGTDDPMARPLVKYPVNHHLAQVLERAVVIGAVAVGPAVLEGGVFDGDEPTSPGDAPNARRFGDSRAARLTLATRRALGGALELQGSAAHVASPEIATGGGADQTKWSTSLRWERAPVAAAAGAHDMGGMPGMDHGDEGKNAAAVPAVRLRYALAEFALTDEGTNDDGRAFRFTSLLGEAEVALWRVGRVALRAERTLRPEEERLADPFRSVRPATDQSILGRTRWDVLTLHVATRDVGRGGVRAAPFVEVARAHATEVNRPSAFEPSLFYGDATQWHLSAGVRVGAGMRHHRMGRYGVAER